MKKVLFIVICIASFFIINGLIHSITSLWQKQRLIVTAQDELIAKKKEHQELTQTLSRVSTEQFVETEARDKLFLGKPGEEVVIIPQDLLTPTVAPQKPMSTPQSNWSLWLKLVLNPSS